MIDIGVPPTASLVATQNALTTVETANAPLIELGGVLTPKFSREHEAVVDLAAQIALRQPSCSCSVALTSGVSVLSHIVVPMRLVLDRVWASQVSAIIHLNRPGVRVLSVNLDADYIDLIVSPQALVHWKETRIIRDDNRFEDSVGNAVYAALRSAFASVLPVSVEHFPVKIGDYYYDKEFVAEVFPALALHHRIDALAFTFDMFLSRRLLCDLMIQFPSASWSVPLSGINQRRGFDEPRVRMPVELSLSDCRIPMPPRATSDSAYLSALAWQRINDPPKHCEDSLSKATPDWRSRQAALVSDGLLPGYVRERALVTFRYRDLLRLFAVCGGYNADGEARELVMGSKSTERGSVYWQTSPALRGMGLPVGKVAGRPAPDDTMVYDPEGLSS